MNRTRLLVVLVLLCMPAAASATIYRFPLKDFLAVDIVALKGASDNTEARGDSIPIAARWDVKSAVLRFEYTCSKALLPGSSHLTVLVNDLPVGQIPLDPRAPEGQAEITIKPKNLQPGYNRLVIAVSQHATREECEDPTLPELWTRVDLTTAELELDLSPVSLPETLASIGAYLFDARDLVSDSLHIVVPEITPAYLSRAGLAAAGAALRREYRPLRITLSDRLAEDRDNLVIGPAAFLETLELIPANVPAGASIGITRMKLPEPPPEAGQEVTKDEKTDRAGEDEAGEPPLPDPYHGVVCIVGDTDEELDRAARAFSLMSTAFPQAPFVAVSKVAEPELSSYRYRNVILEGRDYSLSSLGFSTTTFRGTRPSPEKITFRLPSDVHVEPNQSMMLSLNLVYGSGIRSDSALNLEVNGKFVAAIPLSDTNGGSFHGYQVQVLGSALQPGDNTLRLVPVLTTPVSDPCAPVQTENLVLTVFEDSYLTVPAYAHWARMPSLEAFVKDGFPFGLWPDMRETAICLPAPSFGQAAAALNIVAMATQKIGYPPTGLSWHLGPLDEAPEGKNVILAGTFQPLEAGSMESEGVSLLDRTRRILQPQLYRPDGRENPPQTWRSRLARWLGKTTDPLPSGQQVDSAEEVLRAEDSSGWGFLVETALGRGASSTLLVMTAQGEEDLLRTAHYLWDSGLQASVSGGAAAISLVSQPPQVTVIDTGEKYYLGEVGPLPAMSNLINRYPWRALGLLLVILGVCSLLIYFALKKFRSRRLADMPEDGDEK